MVKAWPAFENVVVSERFITMKEIVEASRQKTVRATFSFVVTCSKSVFVCRLVAGNICSRDRSGD
jgi:hypothetical protein